MFIILGKLDQYIWSRRINNANDFSLFLDIHNSLTVSNMESFKRKNPDHSN